MDLHRSDAMELTRELIRIESTDPGAYEGEIGTFICSWLAERQIPAVTKEVLPGRRNILAKIQGESDKPSLVFICHMDTVVPGEGWTRPPFSAAVQGGRIYGRGACDMKSGLACAMSVFARIFGEKRKPSHSLVFIATVDEEDFMRGAEDVVKSGWVTADDWILDMEPTGGQILASHKGRVWFEISVSGVTAHASTPWKGADAIAGMAEIITDIRSQIALCPAHPDFGRSTVTFGQIEGGYRPYVVPDSCKVWIDMRLVPPTDSEAASCIVKSAVEKAQLRVPGIQGCFTVTGNRPYIEKDETSFLLGQLRRACARVTGEEPAVGCFPGYTDTAVIAGITGNRSCMSYGPGRLEIAHKPDEYVSCEDVLRCEEVLETLARQILFDA